MTAVLASIPSPSSGALTIGPLSIHAYGLMIALGVIAAVWLLGRRLELSGVGTREDASSIAVWAVIAGVIGSRLYHVVTDWELFKHDLIRIPQIWRGGLGIPGGIFFGTLAAAWAFKRRGIAPAVGVGIAAPSLPRNWLEPTKNHADEHHPEGPPEQVHSKKVISVVEMEHVLSPLCASIPRSVVVARVI